MIKVFIDGSAGTTGLKIHERLSKRNDVNIIELPLEHRKDNGYKLEAFHKADVVFLCLPDDAAIEAVNLAKNCNTKIIDTSTAHRTNPDFIYGMAELVGIEKIANSTRVANPGCHARGFIALIAPLIEHGLLNPITPLSCYSITGYSGGGKKMIGAYQENKEDASLLSPRQYGLKQNHKHINEMMFMTKLERQPSFSPIVSNYFSGMNVTIPLFRELINCSKNMIIDLYKSIYNDQVVKYVENCDDNGFLNANRLMNKDLMEISVHGKEDIILLNAVYDNLGIGACGSAIQNMNIITGIESTYGLIL